MPMPRQALAELAGLAGWPADIPDRTEIRHDDPVLRTTYRVGAAGAAALAAVGLAAGEVWALRSGRRQRVAVDLRHAAASLRSATYLKLDRPGLDGPADPLTGFYETGDGSWIYFHCNFPHHRDGVLALLG